MSITYTWGNMSAHKRTEAEKCSEYARGVVPYDELVEMGNHAAIDRAPGHIVIEFRDKTYTPDSITGLSMNESDYGVVWRAWYGDPTPEQMAAEPWEEAEDVNTV